jgi:hypothetical protein
VFFSTLKNTVKEPEGLRRVVTNTMRHPASLKLGAVIVLLSPGRDRRRALAAVCPVRTVRTRPPLSTPPPPPTLPTLPTLSTAV